MFFRAQHGAELKVPVYATHEVTVGSRLERVEVNKPVKRITRVNSDTKVLGQHWITDARGLHTGQCGSDVLPVGVIHKIRRGC